MPSRGTHGDDSLTARRGGPGPDRLAKALQQVSGCPLTAAVSEDIGLEPLEGNVTGVILKVADKNQDALKLTL